MSDTTDEETREADAADGPFRVRDVFQFRRQPKPEQEPEGDAGPEIPPVPENPPLIPAQAPAPVGRAARTDAHVVPNWWDPQKDITAPVPACEHPNARTFQVGTSDVRVPYWCPDCKTSLEYDPPDEEPKPRTKAPAPGKPCEHPTPHAVRSRPDNKLVAFWCADCETQLPVPDDFDELAEFEDTKGESGEEGEGGDKVPSKLRDRWRLRGDGSKTYSRPRYAKKPEKKSLVEWWTGRDQKSRFLLYNGTALGGGFTLGIPQFFTHEVAYLVQTYHSWTDFYVCIWYGIAAAIWMWDCKSRTWLPPFALVARVPLISMIVGSLLYGSTDLTV